MKLDHFYFTFLSGEFPSEAPKEEYEYAFNTFIKFEPLATLTIEEFISKYQSTNMWAELAGVGETLVIAVESNVIAEDKPRYITITPETKFGSGNEDVTLLKQCIRYSKIPVQ